MPVMTKTPRGDEIVILSRSEYDQLLASGEDRADAATLNRAIERRTSGTEDLLTRSDLDKLLAAKTPLAFWRNHRGLSQGDVAKSVGISQGFLSEIESGKKTGDVKVLRKIADTLQIAIDDLVA